MGEGLVGVFEMGGGGSCSQCSLHCGPVDMIWYASSSCFSSPKRFFTPPFFIVVLCLHLQERLFVSVSPFTKGVFGPFMGLGLLLILPHHGL